MRRELQVSTRRVFASGAAAASLLSACVHGASAGDQRVWATAPDGVRLALDVTGEAGAPSVLFIHGFAMSREIWRGQMRLPGLRCAALDLRGHGASDKPDTVDAYNRNEIWADDIHATINAAELDRPVLVGWSFGGRIICEYLEKYGEGALGGIVFVAGYTLDGPQHLGAALLQSFPLMLSDDAELQDQGARQFVRAGFSNPAAHADDAEVAIAIARSTPLAAKRGMVGRPLAFEHILSRLSKPILFLHGADDALLRPSISADCARLVRHADARLYKGAGHFPFVERRDAFSADIRAFVTRTSH